MAVKLLDLGKLVVRNIIGVVLAGGDNLIRVTLDLGTYFNVMSSKRAVDAGTEPLYPFTTERAGKKLVRTFSIDGATVILVYNGFAPEFYMEKTEAEKRYQPMVDTVAPASAGLVTAFS